MKIKEKNNLYILFIFSLLIIFNSYGQKKEEVEKKAMLYALIDSGDFPTVDKYGDFSGAMERFTIEQIDSKVYDCYIYKIKEKSPSGTSCDRVMAYVLSESQYYKVEGFLHSQFTEFCNKVLFYGGNINFDRKRMNRNKMIKFIVKYDYIKDYDIKRAYKKYYNNPQEELYDNCSCTRKVSYIELY
ncbi:MAG: hypothetical protein H3C31_12595 [Brumimicrobium sp.]|nr:hypothetical protein [Brumimicrobium sp.]